MSKEDDRSGRRRIQPHSAQGTTQIRIPILEMNITGIDDNIGGSAKLSACGWDRSVSRWSGRGALHRKSNTVNIEESHGLVRQTAQRLTVMEKYHSRTISR